MGLSVVKVASGGLPVTIATTGGLPCTEATNGFGIAVTQSPTGSGLAVTGFAFGPTIALSASSVLESAAVNTTVGTLSVSGSYTGTAVFTLADSAGGKFNISGTTLRTNAALDYETATSHNIIVACSGTTPATPNKSFTIAVLDVVAAAAPVLALTSVATDTTPDFLLSGDLVLNDVVRFQYSTAADFTGASELTNAIDAGEDAANSISFSTSALALGAWYFRARIERPDAPVSGWSNTVTVTLIAGAYDASTTAWVNAVVAAGGTVSDTQKTRVDALIVGLKADSLWTLLDAMWIPAGELVSQQALIDIKSLTSATAVGSPGLAAGGYVGNGSSAYINTNFTAYSNFTQNSCAFGYYNTTVNATAEASVTMGFFGSAVLSFISSRYGGTDALGACNRLSASVLTNTNRQGFYVVTGPSVSVHRMYKDGNTTPGFDNTATGEVPPSIPFFILARNDGGTPSNYSTVDRVGLSFISAGLSAAQQASLFTRIEAYMDAWGVGVV